MLRWLVRSFARSSLRWDAKRRPAEAGLLGCTELRSRLLRLEHSVRLVHDHFAGGDLRRVRSDGSSFSSRIHVAATRVDSLAWSDVSKRLTDVTTPSPASIKKKPPKPGSLLMRGMRLSPTFFVTSSVAVIVDSLVASHCGIHVVLLTSDAAGRSVRLNAPSALKPGVRDGEEKQEPRGFRAWPTR